MKKRLLSMVLCTAALLAVPTEKTEAAYHVKSGDTMARIADHYDMNLKDLIRINPHIDNANLIHIGDPIVTKSGDKIGDIIDYARSLQDVTIYQYGGQNAPYATDCSGWIQSIYKEFGVNLPRVSRDQAKVGQPVTFRELKRGDLMFFSTASDKTITHVGIHLGNDYWISNLNSKKNVEILSTWGSWSQKYFMWGQRVI